MDAISEVRTWFFEHVRDGNNKPFLIDDEQARAVIDEHKNTLVSARAGSGKTHTLVAKAIYQVAVLDRKPTDIIAFVFNKKAALEINERLQRITVDNKPIIDEDTKIASTFHAFAHNIITEINGRGSFGKILMDGERAADTARGRALYIQAVIDYLQDSDPWVGNVIYAFFRNESKKIDKDIYDTPEEYYDKIRNHGNRTLDGKSVRSFSEKIIADFFFEHGVKYKYEPEYYPRNFVKHRLCKPEFENAISRLDNIKGDFFLKKEKILWEHWAIRGDENDDEIRIINESGAIGDYDYYKNKKNWKRWFYIKEWRNEMPELADVWYTFKFKKLVESYRPLHQSREDFERCIEQICIENDILLRSYGREDLVRRAWKKQVKYFALMITSFIDRTHQMYFDNIEGFENMIMAEPEDSEDQIRTKRFHQVGLLAYKEYLKRLKSRGDNGLTYVNDSNEDSQFSDYGTDFSMLLQESRSILQAREADAMLKQFRDVKLILVDEYQDFSRLFYDNLVGIRAIFPDAKLFCVGDDWQAINRFAGSDDKYFSDFAEHFSDDTEKLLISNNYRSAPEIVETANSVMQKLVGVDESGFAKAHNQERGKSIIKSIDLGQFELSTPPEKRHGETDLEKYVEMIGQIIIKHKNDKRIIILHRKHDMLFNFNVWGVIRHRVRDYVTSVSGAMTKTKFDETICFDGDTNDVMTVHKSKGIESDTVIILEVDPKVFPSDSYNTELFSIFGDNYEVYKKDEARLYYVALTRAKTNLYVLWGANDHRSDDVPGFIRALG
jgi:DNA helicase-4